MVRGHSGNLARTPGLHPYSFSKDILGFLMTTESQDLSLTSHLKDGAFSSIVSPSLSWGVRTHTDHRVRPPAGLTNTSSSSNLVFPGVSIQVLTSSTLLSFSGNRSWAAGWSGCWQWAGLVSESKDTTSVLQLVHKLLSWAVKITAKVIFVNGN